jgi:hypothetical protein
MSIWFHGTLRERAGIILKEGFKAGTNFAKHLESSLVMGGPYVFWVFFEKDPTDCWEYVSSKPVGPDKILLLRRYNIQRLYDNEDLAEKIRYLNHTEQHGENINHCKKCTGKGEINDRAWDEPRKERNKKLVVCPDCKGFGFLKRV